MANLDKKTSQLPAAIEMTEDDAWAGIQAGTDKSFTPALMRKLMGLPRAVTNLTAAASLVAIVAAGGAIRFNRGATLTLSSTAHRLTQPVDGTLDLNGGKLLFGYKDESNTTNFNARDIRNGTIEIGAGFNIERLIRFANPGGRMNGVTVRSVDVINNIDDNDDAAIRVDADDFVAEDVTLENMRLGFRITGSAVMRNIRAKDMVKAIVGDGGRLELDGFYFDGTNSGGTTTAGHNAIGGLFSYLRFINGYIYIVGEHGAYFAGAGKTAGGEIYIENVRCLRTGQCSLKLKDYTRVDIDGWHGSWTSYGNSPGLNEEGFRLQRCGLVTGGDINITKEMVAGAPAGSAGFAHMFLSACDNVVLLKESYAEGSARGLVFAVDDLDPSLPHGNYAIRVRHKDLGAASVIIDDNAIINGTITVYVDIDGCPGAPVTIGAGVTWGPNAKLRVIGTYRNCGAPPPASTANVDLSGLRPADSLIPYADRRISPWVAAATLTIAASNLPEISEFGNQGGTIASFTAVLPVGKDGQKVNLRTRAAVTALTVTATGGASVYGAPGSFAAGGHATLEFVASENAWFRAE